MVRGIMIDRAMMPRTQTTYKVWMDFGEDGIYLYGTYTDRNRANEVAMEVREQRGCETYVE